MKITIEGTPEDLARALEVLESSRESEAIQVSVRLLPERVTPPPFAAPLERGHDATCRCWCCHP